MSSLFVKTLLDGLLLGGIYVTIGAGFALVFGVLDVIDFAVGSYVMLGAYAASALAPFFGSEGLYTIPVIIVLFFILGVLIQPFLSTVVSGDRPLPILMSLAFTFGLAIFFRGTVRLIFGVNSREIPTDILAGNISAPVIGTTSTVRLATAVFGFSALLAFLYFLYRTQHGTGIRAIAEDKTNARLMGIDINQYQALTYGLYVALTATGGVFVGLIYSASPSMALHYTTFAFFMVVLAGLGYVPGVIGTAILLGVAQTLIAVYISTEMVLLFLFLGVYILLLLRPSGIFGRGETA